MSVTQDIARSYRAPREVHRRRLNAAGENTALAVLMAACFLMFVAQWPFLARLAFEDPSIPLEARMAGALMGWIFVMPLLAYTTALLTQLVGRVVSGPRPGLGYRMALFWTLLAVSPLWLLNGLVAGMIGPGPALYLVGGTAALAFCVIWGSGLIEIHKGESQPS